MYKHNLAYRTYAPVDWCPQCNTTLAREQVIGEDRVCDRCQTPVTKKDLNQWLFRITKYADELLDFSTIDWPERVRLMQKNWIGRSEGANVVFKTAEGHEISVFTTRVDTIFGATFVTLAPENPLAKTLTTADRLAEVEAYQKEAKRLTEIDRLTAEKEKTGVFTGSYALNPLNGASVPIFVADYVVMHHGTGAVMGVPAHDERDFHFARKYDLPIITVVAPPDWDEQPLESPYTGEGKLVNSGSFSDFASSEGAKAITEKLEEINAGGPAVSYRMRDWLISRQRFWGAPIPILYCEKCGTIPVPEEDLPVILPDDVDFRPTGESPLKYHEGFRYTTCPECGGAAERETDTMDTFVDSSWYWYRYVSPHYAESFMDAAKARLWVPVDEYAGGIEHATMHLLYARFFTKALNDMGHVSEREPFTKLFNQGLILGEDNEKMSKSRGNVIDPNDIVSVYGSDVFRTFLMFIGPWSKGGPWSNQGIKGVARFYQKVWSLLLEPMLEESAPISATQTAEIDRKMHQTTLRVSQGIERFEFNTAIAALMEFVNFLHKLKATFNVASGSWTSASKTLILCLAPFAPYLSEELWSRMGYPYSVHQQQWPEYDKAIAADETTMLIINVNGKVRDRIEVPTHITEDEATSLALQSEKVQPYLESGPPKRIVYVAGRLINLVT
jgi:leucyl-tRNA synthetase